MPLHVMEMIIPAEIDYALSVGLAVDGMGMKAGLSLELLADLRALCAECIDALAEQNPKPERIKIISKIREGRFHIAFYVLPDENEHRERNGASPEMVQSILETLMPQVAIEADGDGIHRIKCSMPV